MEVQQAISRRRLAARVGQTLTVLVDEVTRDHAIARSTADAPEIDGLVYVEDGGTLKVGEFTRVVVHAADEHDLHARCTA
jgi:ribosomal protein S12 methylthiotransferase